MPDRFRYLTARQRGILLEHQRTEVFLEEPYRGQGLALKAVESFVNDDFPVVHSLNQPAFTVITRRGQLQRVAPRVVELPASAANVSATKSE